MREEKVIVLDYLPQGYAGMRKIEPIIQGMGTNFFALLELVATSEVELNEEIRIDDKDKVVYIRRKLKENELTNFAKSHLEETIKKIVKSKEAEFVKFFNTSTRISIRMHKLELLPSIGKKHVSLILSERKKPFESFDDIKKRIGITVEMEQMLAKRIIEELKGNEKYYLFVPHFPTPTAPRR